MNQKHKNMFMTNKSTYKKARWSKECYLNISWLFSHVLAMENSRRVGLLGTDPQKSASHGDLVQQNRQLNRF